MRPRKNETKLGELSQSVKKLREALGQTQQQFAQTARTAITTIARYETGRAPHGRSLVRLAEIASENNLLDVAEIFRNALLKELGSWDTSGFGLSLEPKNDDERLYVSAVLVALRNLPFTKVIPKLNKLLKDAADASIQQLDWAKGNVAAGETAREMANAGSSVDDIAKRICVPVHEVRDFLTWDRVRSQLAKMGGKPVR